MGADLMVVMCPAPKIISDDDVTPQDVIPPAKEALRQRIDAIEDSLLLDMAEAFNVIEYDYDSLDDGAEVDEVATAQAIRTQLADEERLDYLFGYTRDVAEFHVENKTYLVSGGMSWGDESTDAYKWLALYAELGVTREPIRLGKMAQRPVELRIGSEKDGIVITLGPPRPETPGAYDGGMVASTWHDPDDSSETKAAIDTLEALVLAHAAAGVDVTSNAYQEGVETVLLAIVEQVGE